MLFLLVSLVWKAFCCYWGGQGPNYIKKKTEGTSQEKIPLVQQKKDMISFLLQHTDHQGHDWQPHRSGAMCGLCRIRVPVKSMLQEIKEVMNQERKAQGPEKPVKTPRMTIIQQLISTSSSSRRPTFDARNAGHMCWPAQTSRLRSLHRRDLPKWPAATGHVERPSHPCHGEDWHERAVCALFRQRAHCR